jgi:NADH dehydrogenase
MLRRELSGFLAGRSIGRLVDDVVITCDEIQGLMRELLYTESPPAGTTRLTAWAREHATTLGTWCASELSRRHNRQQTYERL